MMAREKVYLFLLKRLKFAMAQKAMSLAFWLS